MRRFAAVCALAGAALLAPSAALAAPPLDVAERLCDRQGGNFVPGSEQSIYACRGAPDASEIQRAIAERLCENVYRGIYAPDGPGYLCNPS
jgi:hypothetical protein